jgi:hypothetical protein
LWNKWVAAETEVFVEIRPHNISHMAWTGLEPKPRWWDLRRLVTSFHLRPGFEVGACVGSVMGWVARFAGWYWYNRLINGLTISGLDYTPAKRKRKQRGTNY